MKKCKVCGINTDTIFNINFTKIPICEECADAITIQQIKWYMEQPKPKADVVNVPDPGNDRYGEDSIPATHA